MPIYGLVFLMNIYPEEGETFTIKKRYRFISKSHKDIKIMIDLDIYPNKICVVSFFRHEFGSGKAKYRVRTEISGAYAIRIFKACLQAFYQLPEPHAFVYSAANDLGIIVEDNARNSAYRIFLSRYFIDFENHVQNGSIRLNTMMLYPQDFIYATHAEKFFASFETDVEDGLCAHEPDVK